jgi:hypothetical protein
MDWAVRLEKPEVFTSSRWTTMNMVVTRHALYSGTRVEELLGIGQQKRWYLQLVLQQAPPSGINNYPLN